MQNFGPTPGFRARLLSAEVGSRGFPWHIPACRQVCMEVAHGLQVTSGTASFKGSSTAMWLQELKVQVCDNGCRATGISLFPPLSLSLQWLLHLRSIDPLEESWQLSGDVLTERWKNKPRKIWQR